MKGFLKGNEPSLATYMRANKPHQRETQLVQFMPGERNVGYIGYRIKRLLIE